ncbi:hypothetical protein K0817_000815 [Microbacterium sp. HD4P20]|uniref:hypothetical protein n=1 Tax=Microbacterium sp. HD4P20 TaxID=2864874 RepID=UPI001C63D963|nr:hypothetical protein [Microbacterium sp. HD4P20]MCP2635105.1 hypothetical protein [Microbacterium sp. HD4P20]
MAVAPVYTLSLEPTWLPVPLRFPWGTFARPEDWAAELAGSLLIDTGAGDQERDLLGATALHLQGMPGPLPGAMERFWRTEFVGGVTIVAHLYVTDSDAATPDDLVQLSRAGVGGVVQTWATLDDTAFDTAITAVVVAGSEQAEVYGLRYLGIRDGFVFLLDLLHDDPLIVDAVQAELERIFRSIRFA